MASLQKFTTDVEVIGRFYAPEIKCTNCDFTSNKQDRFINPADSKLNLCLVCDEFGIYLCDTCQTSHRHEMDCTNDDGNRMWLAAVRGITSSNKPVKKSFYTCLECECNFTDSDTCPKCGLELPF